MRRHDKIIIAITLALLLYLSNMVYADLLATEGFSIDLSSAGAGLDQTIAFDPTEFLGSRTWGDGSTDTIVWTWNRATGTDPTITFGNGALSTNSTWTASSFIGALTGNADTVTTNANLTNEVTSIGNSATIADSVTVTGWVLGTSSATQITSPTLITNLIDTTGAADIDYGSGDVTDHTFIADGGTAIIDGSYTFPDADGAASSTGELQYDNTITGLDDGGLTFFDDDEVQTLIGLDSSEVLAAADDLKLVQYNWNAGAGFWNLTAAGVGDMTKAVYDSGNSGGVDVITSVDSTSATDFVLLTDTAVGTDAVKTDGALTYAATTGTLGATEFVGGGVGITGITAVHAGTITWTGTSILESGVAFQFGDGTDATLTHTYANTGTNTTMVAESDRMVFSNRLAVGTGDAFTHLAVGDITVSTTTDFYGLVSDHTKTAGATDQVDNIYGLRSAMTMNHGAGTIGDVYGAHLTGRMEAGTLGTGAESLYGTFTTAHMIGGTAADDIFGMQILTNGDGGTVTDDVYGTFTSVDLEAAMTSIGGDVFGSYIIVDADEDPVGTAYMLYLDELTNVDFGIFQNGTAANQLGGALTVTAVINTSVGVDAVGAVDMDWGSADVTDHQFFSDGTGTAEFVLVAGAIDGTEILDDTVTLTTDTNGDYVTSLVAGLAIDVGAAAEGGTPTVAFDPTELLGSRTFGDASTDTIVWTWDKATGTDPTITFISNGIQVAELHARQSSGGIVRIFEPSASGTESTIFQAVAQAGDITYSLPPDNGDLDEVLRTDGAGVLTWNLVSDTMIDFGLGATQVSIADLPIALGGGSPTVDQMQEYLDNTGSSGFFLGGAISDGGAGTVDVAAGSGFIRTTNDDNAQLESFKWSASSTIAVADNTTQYIYVDDAGAISLSASEFLERPDLIKIGVVTDEGGAIIHTFNLGVRLQESVAEAGRFIRRVHGISRDKRRGGLIMGQSGDANRDVTLSAGSLWWGRTEYSISALDTSGADTFATYSAGGSEDAVASQWPNEQYDSAGTLTTMTNNRWANLFFFLEPDDHTVMIYGRAQFLSEALADEEDVPSTSLPSRVSETSVLVARFTFQKSANTATISSAFEDIFANASASDHTTLANIAWTSSGHTGTVSTFAGFDGAGAATEYTEANYLLVDGSRALSANWDVGAFTITGTQFISDIAGGTAPFVVTSTTEVANLKAATATLATTVTVSDDESTDDEHEIVFTTDNVNLESDGDITYNPSTGELRVGKIVGDERHWLIPIINPLAAHTESGLIPIWTSTPAALTVTGLNVTLSSAANDVTGDLKYADDRITLANPVVINDFDTTSGVRVDTSITSGAIPAGKFVYMQYDVAPNTAITDMTSDVTWDYD